MASNRKRGQDSSWTEGIGDDDDVTRNEVKGYKFLAVCWRRRWQAFLGGNSGAWIITNFLSEEYVVHGRDAVQSGKVRRRFGETYCLHLQDGRVTQASNPQNGSCKQSLTLQLETIRVDSKGFWRQCITLTITDMRTEKYPVSETLCSLLFMTPDDRQSPKTQQFCERIRFSRMSVNYWTVRRHSPKDYTSSTCLGITIVSTLPTNSLMHCVWLSE
jgi:hypothetical protein